MSCTILDEIPLISLEALTAEQESTVQAIVAMGYPRERVNIV